MIAYDLKAAGVIVSKSLNTIRRVNLVLSAVGAAVFAALFLYIAVAPKDFDQRTRDFAIAKVKDKVDGELSGAARSETADSISDFAGVFSERLQTQIEEMRAGLDAGAAGFIADVLAAACKLDCERRAQAEIAVTAFYEATIARYGVHLERMQNLIEGEYDAIMSDLRADLKIFTASSFAALAFALLLSIFRGPAAAHLLPFSFALSGSTVLATLWYALGQDWVMTIIFSNYWGWAYPSVLAVIAFFLCDIAANKARITSFVLNGIGNAFGGAFQFAPC